MKHGPLVEGGPEGSVQPVLEVELTLPLDHVREQVSVERGVLGQQRVQVELALGRHELVEPDLAWRKLRPVPRRQTVLGIGASIAHRLEDHASSLKGAGRGRPLTPEWSLAVRKWNH